MAEVCIDYRKLNEGTRKDHSKALHKDQMLERLAGNQYYCFLDGFSGYFQIPIDPKDQEKTTFTCPYGTFAYRRMPFGLCNAPGTFQRCMMAIFHDMIEKTMEVFMDDFSVFGDSFSTCLSHLEKMLKRCEDTNLSLNWEKSHFMVKEGIVLGHKISKSGLEVDRAKVEVIAKLPHPTTVKGVRSFLGHAGFYRRFIQDFSKIARPMTHLLEKETPFFFSEECIDSFNTLKRKLTEAPILIAPDWNSAFELMCDQATSHGACILPVRNKDLFAKKDAKANTHAVDHIAPKFDIEIRDKKGAENLAADHLSRLENPHQDKLENKEINEAFPLETLGSVALKIKVPHGFSRFATTMRGRFVIKGMTSHKKINSSKALDILKARHKNPWEKIGLPVDKLDDALWAFRTAYKIPIGCTPYKLVYGKACHLPIELEHKAYWALKHTNFDVQTAGDHRKVQLNELNELRDQAYENSLIYKEKTHRGFTDAKIKNRFNVGERVLLFNI
ncbi:reverse transcriptase domain-containing protein [Tanacetum coccineum]